MKASIKTGALVIGAAMVLCSGGCINMSESNVSTVRSATGTGIKMMSPRVAADYLQAQKARVKLAEQNWKEAAAEFKAGGLALEDYRKARLELDLARVGMIRLDAWKQVGPQAAESALCWLNCRALVKSLEAKKQAGIAGERNILLAKLAENQARMDYLFELGRLQNPQKFTQALEALKGYPEKAPTDAQLKALVEAE